MSDQIELQNLEVALRKCEKGPDESLYHEKKGLEKFFRVFKQYLTNYYRENNIDEHANYLNEGEDGDDSDY